MVWKISWKKGYKFWNKCHSCSSTKVHSTMIRFDWFRHNCWHMLEILHFFRDRKLSTVSTQSILLWYFLWFDTLLSFATVWNIANKISCQIVAKWILHRSKLSKYIGKVCATTLNSDYVRMEIWNHQYSKKWTKNFKDFCPI